jgi:hypothetical protein
MEAVQAIEVTALRSPELRRRLGKVYALLLRLPASKTPSADQAARPGAPGAEHASAIELEAQGIV